MIKKFLLGTLYSVILGFLVANIASYFLVVDKSVDIKPLEKVYVDNDISNMVNIKDEVKVEKQVTKTDYLNSWKLMATVLGSTSYALVVREAESKVLKIDSMLEGFKVAKIEKDKIFCVSESQDLWLHMKKDFVQSGGALVPVAEPTRFELRKALVDVKLRRPDSLLQEVNITPLLDGNKFAGLKVSYLREGGFLYNYGLRKGDVITKFNGNRLTSLSDGISVYQKVLGAQKFSITVIRKNKEEELFYEVR